MLPSEKYYSEADLSEIMQELQQSITDRESLQVQNSELRSEIEELKSVNLEQHEQIVRLQQSDLELKEAKRLRGEAESLFSQNSTRERRLNLKESSLRTREEKVRDTESVVNNAVDKAIKEETAKLKSSYARSEENLILKWGFWLMGLIIWCGVILIFSILQSPIFLKDIGDFFTAIGKAIANLSIVIWTTIPEAIVESDTENTELLITIVRVAGMLITLGLIVAATYFIVQKKIIRLIRQYKLWNRFLAAGSVVSLQVIVFIGHYWDYVIRMSDTTIAINAFALWLSLIITYLIVMGVYRSEHPWIIATR